MILLSFVLLVFSLIFEVSFTSLPLTLIVLILLTVIFKRGEVFFFAFLSGFLLDILSLKTIGVSSLFFVSFLFLVLMYQSKFEIETKNFVAISTFLASLGFLFLYEYSNLIIFQAITCSVISLVMFIFIKRFTKIGVSVPK